MAAVIVILLMGCYFWKRPRTGKAHSSYLVLGNFSRESCVRSKKKKKNQFMFAFTLLRISIVLKFTVR